ncbi:MAG: hypothetical protein WD050_03280 [Actinomycetota bacterium]
MGAIGCVLASALVLGGGSRIVMRVTAIIADPEFIGTPTTGGNTIGRITFAGSIGLVWLGALGGVPLAVAYLVARRWLPRQPLFRGIWFGLLTMGVFGNLLVGDTEAGTADFRFADPAPQLVMYGTMFLLFGLVGSSWAERLGRGLPEPRPSTTGYVVLGVVTIAGVATIAGDVATLLG